MRLRETFQKRSGKKAVWTIIVIALVLVIALFVSANFAGANTDTLWGRTLSQIRITFVSLGSSLGLVEEREEVPPTPTPNEDEEVDKPEVDAGLPPLTPPTTDGADTNITDSVVERPSAGRGIFVVNTHLRAGGNLQVSGSSELANLSVLGFANLSQLAVSGPSEMVGMISALGGIRTGGADIDLEGGSLIGVDFITGIQAGENVVISGPSDNPIISVPNIPRSSGGGGSSGVQSLNGERGAISLIGGNDIAINGLTIDNTSTLSSIRNRGGCVGCLLDSDVADNLTIDSGTINNTVIGGVSAAEAYFTNITVGPDRDAPVFTVDASSATFSGRVRGADAVEMDEFATLGQLMSAVGGGGVAGVSSLNSLFGNLTIAGTAGQVNVAASGSTITLSLPQDISITASPTFASLILTGGLTVDGSADILGFVRASSFESSDGTVRRVGEEVLRSSISVFPYALPADTGSTTFVRVSKDYSSFDNPINEPPSPALGMTRAHRLMLKYADSVPASGSVEWRIYEPSTGSTIDSFTTTGLNRTNLEDPQVLITDPVNIPPGDWRIEVRVPSGRVRVMDIHILAFDVVS